MHAIGCSTRPRCHRFERLRSGRSGLRGEYRNAATSSVPHLGRGAGIHGMRERPHRKLTRTTGHQKKRRSATEILPQLCNAGREEKSHADLHIGVAHPDEAGKDTAYVIRHVGSVNVDENAITTPATTSQKTTK